ncbi:MAG: hypothetical protein KIT09_12115 [Bryobacteraceae bacterium]|nr:hypothetical protein [Bryobacteraceae bacterium]
MPRYRIYRLKEPQRDSFRWAPHTSGATTVKPKDYVEQGATEAETPYGAWVLLKESGEPLKVGDMLESPDGGLRICKYVGFEEAAWLAPEAAERREAAAVE